MALTAFQRTICHIIAANRLQQGESYVAGAAALNTLMGAPRMSRDIDLFHDTDEALARTWAADRMLLESNGYVLDVLRERPNFVEALVLQQGESALLQWVRDSAYRFFPLISHVDFGLTLHPHDLATNKVLAAVGRLEVRDWIDLIECHRQIQPLGYMAWAACGKDPGFSPVAILEHAARASHYSAEEIAELSFEGTPPDAKVLSMSWRAMLAEAAEIVAALPPAEAGTCVLDARGKLFTGSPSQARESLKSGKIAFHHGSIRGALPMLVRK